MKLLLPLFGVIAPAIAAVDILLPLYVYPLAGAYDGTADWNAAIAAIDAHPDLTFNVIINPNSGPPFASEEGIKKDWAKWIGQINGRPNAVTLGYISTLGTVQPQPRDIAIVNQGIDTYSSWTTAEDWDGVVRDISISGIFFDEVNTAPAHVQYYTQVSNYAKSKTGFVVLNPGVPVNTDSYALYNVADAILSIETCYTADPDAPQDRCPRNTYTPFTPAVLDSLPSDAALKAKSAVVVHDFYDDWEPYQPASLATLQADINAIVAQGVHSLYITQWGYNESFTREPASVGTVSNLLALAQGLSSGQPL
ncbi:spherulin 4-like cell surface [Colletotrichum karsti]|uniref:Spherulin 4-like cell surface n=1 Tax=Colletotrichum karsti TaxID=1095194 RepID=A0A9P6IAA3_9PEZI|nr:spherulin 4-like cell surface [Colletotrichum karsti]KAF9874930.1 spherulin 4-like cell surface [Colletotrichum karsti]